MADEYIRKQEMLDAVDHLRIIPSIDGTGKPTPTEDFRVQFLGTVLKVKPADVVPVVRCKECKFRENDDFCTGRGFPYQLVPDDGFCDKGGRKE